jgi:hypothetical protein
VLALQRAAGNRAVTATLARQSAAPVGGAGGSDAQAAALCVGDKYFKDPPEIEFNGREKALAEATYWSARSIASRAAQALASGDDYLRTPASQILHEDPADLDELADTAESIHQALVDTPFVRGTCSNPVCTNSSGGVVTGGIMADAADDKSKITICPFFFGPTHSLAELVRTWLHEGGHIAGIDDPPPGVPYQHPPNCFQQRGENPFDKPKPYDCPTACPGGDKFNVDNWAYFLDCIGH